MYCYPEDIDEGLISEISHNEKVCKYLDIPIQHVNDEILGRMRRFCSKRSIEELIFRLRKSIPEIAIRTSLIVGFPGETEEQFMELYNFVKDIKLDRVGVFTYSQEEDTDAALYEEQIEDKVKRNRQRRLMSLQKSISLGINKQSIGSIYRVLVEGYDDKGALIGRTFKDAPEIDGRVYIRTKDIYPAAGEFVNVRIVDALEYDLIGEIV
jgi:ribosomal protein S12 methylthiotransferase